MQLISDETFRKELDGYLKKLKIPKKDRNHYIGYIILTLPPEERDQILDEARAKAIVKERILSEDDEQIEFVYQFRKKYPGKMLFYVHNGGSRTPSEKNKQLAMGLVPGVSDLICLELKLGIEMKRKKDYKHSEEQKAFRDYIESIGWRYILAEGCEDGLKKVEHVLLI